MNTAALPEVPRRRRRIDSQVSQGNISYQELLGIHLRQCRIKNLATVTIDGYRTASRYFLDFAGSDLMCGDITQDLINEYCLHLQSVYKPQTVNSYMFKVSPTILFGIEQGYIPHNIQFTHVVEQELMRWYRLVNSGLFIVADISAILSSFVPIISSVPEYG